MGKYIRHGAAVIAGAIVTFIVDALPGVSTIATPEHQAGLVDALTGLLTVVGMALWLMVYAFVEKYLKRFHRLDPEG